jgi:hypothetical protein
MYKCRVYKGIPMCCSNKLRYRNKGSRNLFSKVLLCCKLDRLSQLSTLHSLNGMLYISQFVKINSSLLNKGNHCWHQKFLKERIDKLDSLKQYPSKFCI